MDLTGLGAVADLASGIINRIWPDANEAEKGRLALALAQLQGEIDSAKGQLAVNQDESENPNLFVAGWRPFIGWICGCGLGYQFLVRPLIVGVSGHDFPALELDTLMTLLAGLLGLGGMRTVEKIKGVARK